MKKTLFDVYTSAQKAALNTINSATSYQTENAKLEAFNADANDPADWDVWSQNFDNLRRNLIAMKQQPAPSAKTAVAAKPATAPTGTPASAFGTLNHQQITMNNLSAMLRGESPREVLHIPTETADTPDRRIPPLRPGH